MRNKIIFNYSGKNVEIELTEDQMKLIRNQLCDKKFVPNYGDLYWFVYKTEKSKYKIEDTRYSKSNCYDRVLITMGPVFKYKEEAEVYKEYLETLDKYTCKMDWKDSNINKYYIYFDMQLNSLEILPLKILKFGNLPVFASENDARRFINETGQDVVKKFMFDIWD